jgi:hypothetical protein
MILDSAKNCIIHILLIGSVQFALGFFLSLNFLLSPQSKPLEDYYQKQKRLLDFQVGSAPAENWQGLLAALHLQHINAACSSKKPTTSSSML